MEELETRDTPTTFTWSGLGGDNNWSSNANWVGGVHPTGNPSQVEDLVFPQGPVQRVTNNDLPVGSTFNTIQFSTAPAGGYTLGGNAITLGQQGVTGSGQLIVGLGSTGNTILFDIQPVPGATNEIANVNAGGDLTVAGKLSGAVTTTLTKQGTGTLTLAGDNSGFAGPIQLANSGGIVVITNPNALGVASAAGNTTVGQNASLRVAGGTGTVNEPLLLNGPGVSSDGALINLEGTNTWAGPITLSSDVTIGSQAASETQTITITPAGGAGSMALTFAGQTTPSIPLPTSAAAIQAALNGLSSVAPNKVTVTGSGNQYTVTFDGGAFAKTPQALLTAAGTNATVDVQEAIRGGDPSVLTILGKVDDTGAGFNLTKEGRGEVRLSYINAARTAGNTYRGQTFVNSGILTITNQFALGAQGSAANGTVVNSSLTGQGQLRLSSNGADFTVLDEVLTLNGAGQAGLANRGSFTNLGGDNTWAGLVILGSPSPNGVNVTMGTGTGTLTVSGVVSSPNGPFSLTKLDTGTLIFNNNNTYTGPTFISEGTLDIRDSHALGSNTVTVSNVGTLRLDVEAGIGAPLVDAHGRNLSDDSVTHDEHRLQVANRLFITGLGDQGGGALRSATGINVWTNRITLNGTAAIGVDLDPRPGHPTPDASYFVNDYSLTTTNTIDGGQLNKVDLGQLILPVANTYTGRTLVQAGWVTVQDDHALGTFIPSLGPTVQPGTFVTDGAAVHLRTLTPASPPLNVPENITLAGTGPAYLTYRFIAGKGALMSVGGDNFYSGQIYLSGPTGIGVELVEPQAATSLSIMNPNPSSTNPSTPAIRDAAGAVGGLIKFGSQTLSLEAGGSYTGATDIREGRVALRHDTGLGLATSGTTNTQEAYTTTTTTVQSGAVLSIDQTIPSQAGGIASGVQVTNERLVLNRPGQQVAVAGSVFPAPAGFQLTFDGQTTAPIVPGAPGDEVAAALNALSSVRRSEVQQVDVGVAGSFSLTFAGQTTTIPLSAASPDNGPTGSGSVQEALLQLTTIQKSETETLLVNGSSGTFSLRFNGQVTAPLLFNATAGQVQAALQGLSSIGGVGGTVTVTGATPPGGGTLFTVTFGGNLANRNLTNADPLQPPITATVAGGVSVFPATPPGGDGLGGTVSVTKTALPAPLTGSRFTIAFGGDLALTNLPTMTATPANGAQVTVSTVQDGLNGTVSATDALNAITGGTTYTVTFGGDLANTDVTQVTATAVGGTVPVTGTATNGGIGGNEAQTVDVVAAEGSFTLSYKGNATGAIPITAPASQVQAALNGLANLTAEVGPVSVARAGNVYTITFATAHGADAAQLVATAIPAPNGTPEITVTGVTAVDGAPADAPLVGLSQDNMWRGPVTLNDGTRVAVNQNARINLIGAIDDAPNAAGSDLIKRGQGELLLAGNNTFAGTTYIDQGILTAASSQAFGTTVNGTVVAKDAQLQLQGGITVAGEPLTVQGNGTPAASTVADEWFNVGPAPTNNGLSGGQLPTAGRVTSVATDPTDPNVIYVATAGGGAWKSRDRGVTWVPLFDDTVDAAATLYGGSIVVSPTNPNILYFATGETNGGPNSSPTLGQADNYAGSGVYVSFNAGATWSLLTGPNSYNPISGQAVSKIIVDPTQPLRLYVATGTANVLNADQNAVPGVYRYDASGDRTGAATNAPPTWVNLTANASPNRGGVIGGAPFDTAPPGNAGPDDDYRIKFPQTRATWSDVALVQAGDINSPGKNPGNIDQNGNTWVLYAALGASDQAFFGGSAASQGIFNAVYRTQDPVHDNPTWWIGNGTVYPVANAAGETATTNKPIQPVTKPDQRGEPNYYPVGNIVFDVNHPHVAGSNEWIKITAIVTNYFNTNMPGPYSLYTVNASISVYATNLPNKVDNWSYPLGHLDPYPVNAFTGQLLSVVRSDWDGGLNTKWSSFADPATAFGTSDAAGTTFALGAYDNVILVQDYNYGQLSPRAQREVVYLGGKDGLFQTTNAFTGTPAWADVTLNPGAVPPAGHYHALFLDHTNHDLYSGTDGGVWSFNGSAFADRNGDLSAAQLNAADPFPTDLNQALAAAYNNGLQQFAGSPAWSVTNPGAGGNAGVVRYDPQNPLTAYADVAGVLWKTVDGGQNWTQLLNVAGFSYGQNVFPLVVDKVNPSRILTGGPLLLESVLGGGAGSFVDLRSPVSPAAIGPATDQGTFNPDPGFPLVVDKLSNTYDPDTVYVTDGTAFSVTKNRGVSWTPTDGGAGDRTPTITDNQYTISFQGTLKFKNVPQMTATASPGVYVTLSTATDGTPYGTEAQMLEVVTLGGGAGGAGTFALTITNPVTGLTTTVPNIPYNVPAATLANLITAAIANTQANAQQLVTVQPPDAGNVGSFTLTVGTATTGAIPFGATAFTVQQAINAALVAAASTGTVTVGGPAGGPYTVTFDGGTFAGQPQPLMTATGSNVIVGVQDVGLGGNVASVTVAQASQNEVQDIHVSLGGGSFTLSWGGRTTGAIPVGASPGTVAGALAGIGLTVGVGGIPGGNGVAGPGGYRVTFVGPLAGAAQPLIVARPSGNPGGSPGLSVEEVQHGGPRGPGGTTPVLPNPTGGASPVFTNIAVDPANRDTVYVTVRYTGGQAGPTLLRSTDAGQTWTDVSGNLPGVQTWTAVVDPRTDTIYVGNDKGVWSLPNASRAATFAWTHFGAGMPDVQVHDLQLNQNLNTLTAATYGRGMFQLLLTPYQAQSGAVRAVSGSSIWSGPVTLTGDTLITADGTQQLQNGVAAASLNIVGPVSNAPGGDNFTLTKSGRGTLILSGTNTYRGQTLIQQGVLQVNNPHALGGDSLVAADDTGANTVVAAGATLALSSDLQLEPVLVNGNGFLFNDHFTGALRNISNDNVYTGPLTLGTDTTIGVDSGSTLTIGADPDGLVIGTGTVTDANNNFSFDKELPGTLVLAAENKYSGVTTVNQGAIRVEDKNALGSAGPFSGTVVRDGAQVQISRKPAVPGLSQPAVPTVVQSEPLFLSGTGIDATGALLNVRGDADPTGSNDNTWAGPVTFTIVPNFSPATNPGSQVAIGVADSGVAGVADTLFIDTNIQQDSNLASFGLIKVGPGRLTLKQDDSYTGVTNVGATIGGRVIPGGSLRVQSNGSLGAAPSAYAVQTLSVVGANGTYTLTFDGQTTVPLAATATAAQVQAALNALSSIGGQPEQQQVTVPAAGTFTLSFNGQTTPALAATATAGQVQAALNSLSSVSRPEVQQVRVTGTTGLFALTYNGATTAALPVGASAAAVQSALATVIPAGVTFNVTTPTTGGTTVYNIAFAVAAGNQPQITAAPVNVVTTQDGTAALPEKQTVSVFNTSGTFVLTFNGQTTSPIAIPAAGPTFTTDLAAAIQSALNALPGIVGAGGLVIVQPPTAPGTTDYLVTFGGTLATGNLPPLVASGAGGPAVTAATLADGLNGTVAVTGSAPNLTVTFGGDLAARDVPPITVTATTGGVTTTTAATALREGSGVRVSETPSVSGGKVLTVTFYRPASTNPVPPLTSTILSAPGVGLAVNVATAQRGEDGAVVATGAALELDGGATGISVNKVLTINGDGVPGTALPTGALNNVAGNNTYAGPVTLGTDTSIGAVAGTQLTVPVVQDPTPLTSPDFATLPAPRLLKAGQGTVVLPNANGFGGQTVVNEGVLSINNPQALSGVNVGLAVTVPANTAFTLTFGGQTASLPAGATAATVQAALEALPNIRPGNVAVTQTGAVFTVTFQGALAGTAVLQMTAAGTGVTARPVQLGGRNEVQTVTAIGTVGAFTLTFNGQTTAPQPFSLTAQAPDVQAAAIQAALNSLSSVRRSEVQAVTVIGTAGKFRVTYIDPYGVTQQTTDLDFNAPAPVVQAALEALPGINPGDVTVTSVPVFGGTRYTISFGGALARQDLVPLLAAGTGGATTAVTPVQDGLNGLASVAAVGVPGGTQFTVTLGGDLAGQNLPQIVPTSGTVFATAQAEGSTEGPEVQLVQVFLPAGGQTFTLSFNGQTTGPLSNTASAAQVQAALLGLSTIQHDEQQDITVLGTSGTFKVTFNGQTTADLPFNVPASGGVGPTASLQNALQALTSVGANNVTVTSSPTTGGLVYHVTFVGALGKRNVPQMAANPGSVAGTSLNVTTVTEGLGGVQQSEQQDVTVVGAAGGTFTLTFKGQTTAPLTIGTATPADVQAALRGLSSVNGANVTVTSGVVPGGTVYHVAFTGALANANVPQVTAAGSAEVATTATTVLPGQGPVLTVTGSVAAGFLVTFGGDLAALDVPLITGTSGTATPGFVRANTITDGTGSETQYIGVTATNGTWHLTFDGQTTGQLLFSATAADVAAAINALSNVSGKGGFVTVTKAGTPTGPGGALYTVHFGGGLGNGNLPLMTATTQGGTVVTITTGNDGPEGTTVRAGATLQVAGTMTVAREVVTINGDGFNGLGAINASGGTVTWAAPVIMDSNASVGTAGAADKLVFTVPISDANAAGVTRALNLDVLGPGTVEFEGTGSATVAGTTYTQYTGTTTVGQGLLLLNVTGVPAVLGPLVVGDTVAGTGTVRELLNDQVANGSPVSVNADGVFDLNGRTDTVGTLAVTGGQVTTGPGGQLTTAATTMTGGRIDIGTNGTLTAASVGMTGGATISGADGATAATGPLTMTGSTVGFANTGTLTATDVALDTSTVTFGTGGTMTVNDLAVMNNSHVTFGTNGHLTAHDITVDPSDITLGAGGVLDTSGVVTVTDGSITVGDNGQLNLGDTTLDNSTVSLGQNGTGTVGNLGLTASKFLIGAGSTVTLNGDITADSVPTPSEIDGPGTLDVGNVSRTLTVGNGDGVDNVDLKFTALVASGAQASLVKAGPGRLEFQSSPGFSGVVTLQAGDTQVDAGTTTGAIQLNGGSLSGAGTTGPVSGGNLGAAAVGTVSPGNNWTATPVGTLTTGAATWGTGTTFFVNLSHVSAGAPAAGVDNDLLKVNGNLNLNGATLDGLLGPGIQLGDTFTIVQTVGGTIAGHFAELPGKPNVVFIKGQKFTVDYSDPARVVLRTVKADIASVVLSSDVNPSTLHQTVQIKAVVTPETGAGAIPTSDTVKFTLTDVNDPSNTIDVTVNVGANNTATLDTSTLPGGFLPGGTYTVTAHFNGDAVSFNEADALVPLTQTVEVPTTDPLVGVANPPLSPPIASTPPFVSPATSVGVQDRFDLSTTVRNERGAFTWSIVIKDGSGTAVRTIAGSSPAGGPTVPIAASWDGKDDGGNAVPDGVYTATFSFADQFGNPDNPVTTTRTISVGVDNTLPTADPLVNQNVLIAPGTGLTVPGSTELTSAVDDLNFDHWTITIASGTTTVRTFTGTGKNVDVTWDGTDDLGNTVPDAAYTVTLTAFDQGGNSVSPAAQTVVVLTHPPTITLATNSTVTGSPDTTVYGDNITLTSTVSLPAGTPPAITNLLAGNTVQFFNGVTLLGSGTLSKNTDTRSPDFGQFQATLTVPSFNAGTYTSLKVHYAGTTNFLPGDSALGTHTVNKAKLTVTAADATKVYGDANPALGIKSVTGLVLGEQAADVLSGNLDTTVTPATGAGTYPGVVTQGGLVPNGNYVIDTFVPGTFTVTKAPLTVVIDDATRTIHAANPAFTFHAEGLRLGDPASVVTGLDPVTTAVQSSPVGSYPIAAGGTPTAANYDIVAVVPGTLSVTPIPTNIVVGSGPGVPATVNVYDTQGQLVQQVQPFGPGFTGGVRTVAADFNGDGTLDYAFGTGPGATALVQVVDGKTGAVLFTANPFETFTGGVFVAAGDINNDGSAELVVTPDQGGGPRVVVFAGGSFTPMVSYFGIDDPAFRGGARAGVGDMNGDGFADIAVSAGFQGGPRVSLWDGKSLASLSFTNLTGDFFVFDPVLRNGAYVAIGDVDGDGFGDLIAGAGPGGGPQVKVFSGKSLINFGPGFTSPFANFFAGDINNRGGVRVAAKAVDGDLNADLVTGVGDGGGNTATVYLGKDVAAGKYTPVDTLEDFPGLTDGVFVG
jgi:autotransporter-associated beta strand protein